MKLWKKIVTGIVFLMCLAWTTYCFPHMEHIGDFYWLSSIPTGTISFMGIVYGVVVGLTKWFEQ